MFFNARPNELQVRKPRMAFSHVFPDFVFGRGLFLAENPRAEEDNLAVEHTFVVIPSADRRVAPRTAVGTGITPA